MLPFLEVCGVRYVRPYIQEVEYAVRDRFVGLPVSAVLAMVFPLGQLKQWQAEAEAIPKSLLDAWARETQQGRVFLCRHRHSRDDTRPFCDKFRPVVDPFMLTEKMDRIKRTAHIHEFPGLATKIDVLWQSADNRFVAINKPAGIGCTNELGFNNVGKVMSYSPTLPPLFRNKKWTCGHRLDLCVSGALLVGSSAKTAMTITQVMNPRRETLSSSVSSSVSSPTSSSVSPRVTSSSSSSALLLESSNAFDSVPTAFEKLQPFGSVFTDDSHRKEYIARVSGEMREGTFAVRSMFRVSNGRTLVVSDHSVERDEEDEQGVNHERKGPPTRLEAVTHVRRISYDASSQTSLVHVRLKTGQRHQIRAHLAHIGHPIVNDTKYGWERAIWPSYVSNPVTKLYKDDEDGNLLKMLKQCEEEWCDTCQSVIDIVQSGGTTEGVDKVNHFICLHSFHYSIPELNIDVSSHKPWWVDSPLQESSYIEKV